MDDWARKVVIVTGASGGVGTALCRLLASRGCRLGLVGRSRVALEALAEELRQAGAACLACETDVGERAAWTETLTQFEHRLGPADMFIHTAGRLHLTDPLRPNIDDLAEMLRVHYLGFVYAVQVLLPGMLDRGRGHLVAVGSLGSWRGLPRAAAYSASKAALSTYVESLRPPLRQRGILLTTIHLGLVRTSMTDGLSVPRPWRMLAPDDAARRIIRAVERRQREAAFPCGQAWAMRLVHKLPPWAFDWCMTQADRYLFRTAAAPRPTP
ncbi:MAG: SDR family NAD(P)-dependent oxidoreductase [Gemmataceae bacterium]|nr:SDR family NAD(P)-dependent oxidoreductase [Gemmataceae bacterium]MDW8265363.1 SDR family NAD(P)-dependent oxidoreductase [Gemmataceae bacterium]